MGIGANLLRITSQPIKYERTVQKTRLEIKNEGPSHKMQTKPGKLNMNSQNIKVRLDTIDMRKSMGIHSAISSIYENADRGAKAGQDAVARYVEIGNQMLNIHEGGGIADAYYPHTVRGYVPTTHTFMPSVGAQVDWEANNLNVEYDAADVSFDWRVMQLSMQYIPGGIDMNITQYPSINIEYLGEPNYVPPSSNPNYSGDA